MHKKTLRRRKKSLFTESPHRDFTTLLIKLRHCFISQPPRLKPSLAVAYFPQISPRHAKCQIPPNSDPSHQTSRGRTRGRLPNPSNHYAKYPRNRYVIEYSGAPQSSPAIEKHGILDFGKKNLIN